LSRGAAVARALGVELDAVTHVVPHQANGRMASVVARQLRIEPRRVFVNGDRVGNTGSAAMWLALAELRRGSSRGASALGSGDTVLALGAEATKFMFGGFAYVHA
jgi:3-oxoacyl-[acyl-carrier-protein] synthase-3